ncbi:UNVERIFIED_CONTAM: putative ribonuclease H protein [Sesamum latifolium]|uniref:Ribonuclease H protein n=1 Tax=Sesamum latifolium TaxID=2727402 RepID=A0AAW2WQX2_9LAMI
MLIPILILWFTSSLRNAVKHESAIFSHKIIIRRVVEYLELLYKARKMPFEMWRGDLAVAGKFGFFFKRQNAPTVKMVRWQSPKVGWFKLNCDGAAKGNPGQAGAGGVVRDSQGRLIFALYEYLGVKTNVFAELMAVVGGV